MRPHARGFTLAELLVSLAILGLVATLGIPPLLTLSAGTRVRVAASEIVVALHSARSFAVRHSANAGVKFRPAPGGALLWTLHRDGDGDGVRTTDIRDGTDPQVGPEHRLELGRDVRLGFPPGPPPRDPSDARRRLRDLGNPLRFNRSDIASFDPLGGATPGSAYLTDGRSHLVVVRVLGATGRVRVLRYDRAREVWE